MDFAGPFTAESRNDGGRLGRDVVAGRALRLVQVIPSIDIANGRSRVVFWPGAAAGIGAPTDRPDRIAERFVELGARVVEAGDQERDDLQPDVDRVETADRVEDRLEAAAELAKEWRSDRILRRLESLLLVADKERTLLISGQGDVIEPDERFGITWSTPLAWDVDGRRLVVQSCGQDACRTRVIDPATGDVASLADPHLGAAIGLAGDALVVRGPCRGLPCSIVVADLRDGSTRRLVDGAGLVLVAVGGSPGSPGGPFWHKLTYALIKANPGS